MKKNTIKNLNEESLNYHQIGQPGKIATLLTKPCKTAFDLSLAYTPGVAAPVLEIEKNPADAYKYTNKGNLVAVISNGTAILGLGDRGALASKPVMEGKGVLFKRFADIDIVDIEIDTHDPDKVIEIVKLLEPSFGGVNLEDIKAPECFQIEQKLIEICSIPIFHDDQHGTAIISGAGLLNSLNITGKNIKDIKVVFNGAGAAGIACAKHFLKLGLTKDQIIMCDSKGVIYSGRKDGMTPEKQEFASKTYCRTLEDALKGADVFVGVSVKGCVTGDMLKTMNKNPVVFAMANPDPEITYEEAKESRKDVIMATGRSDYPNQINNVLGFPFIFRGALDVRATKISEKMKIAASYALSELARLPVPKIVEKAYNNQHFEYGPDYIVPKPFDPRIIEYEAVAVAKAACEEKIALNPITDFENYRKSLVSRMKKYWE